MEHWGAKRLRQAVFGGVSIRHRYQRESGLSVKQRIATITAVAALATATAAGVSQASSKSEPVSAGQISMIEDCAFYKKWEAFGVETYYRHCTGERYAVWVNIVYRSGNVETRCFQPNENRYLGPDWMVSNAYWDGRIC
jgi:hypothetical protein